MQIELKIKLKIPNKIKGVNTLEEFIISTILWTFYFVIVTFY